MFTLIYRVCSVFFWLRAIDSAFFGHPLGLIAKIAMPALGLRARRERYGRRGERR